MYVEINWHSIYKNVKNQDLKIIQIQPGEKINVKDLNHSTVLYTLWDEKKLENILKINKIDKIRLFNGTGFQRAPSLEISSFDTYGFIVVNLNKFNWTDKEIDEFIKSHLDDSSEVSAMRLIFKNAKNILKSHIRKVKLEKI